VSGAVEPVDGQLEVRVDVANKGAVDAASLDVRAELGDEADRKGIAGGVPAGASRSARFTFGPPARHGVHVLGLRLDYTEAAVEGRGAASVSQSAYLLLSIGATPGEMVRVSAGEASLDLTGGLPVRVESADGKSHRARVRVLTPRGLNANAPVEVDVPAGGTATAAVPLLRGNVPRPSRHGVVVVAETLDGDLAQAAVTTTLVNVEADPALMPKLRTWIAGTAILLILAAGVAEWRRRKQHATANTGPMIVEE
jgi:hypothetical protein